MPTPITELDMRLLRQAIALSAESRSRKRHPFAALVADQEGNVWVECFNDSRPPTGDPTCHAERLAAAQAARIIPQEKLAGCTLYTSAEPCAMCAGAIYWCGIGRVVYGLSEERLLTLTGDDPENPTLSLPCREVFTRGQRQVEVFGPLLEDEAAVPHHQFWRPAGN
ncbi:nucleoside deaminase [Uliginosibacterium sp. H3]|uniref:Nucleoside deaminase n=1 Tax=Uliginosibacterium silvisoli TaxID=3114758 RepID=A0ABU6K265_9RHOO|nr:nucleoside deaminase [Uliginosibacterium sp. H3]